MSVLSSLWGCSSVWHFLNNRPEGRVSILVAGNKREYELILQEAEFFFSGVRVLGFPEYTQDPYEEARVLPEVFARRASTLDFLLNSKESCIVITTPYGLLKSLPPKDVFVSATADIEVGKTYEREELEYILGYSGYVNVEMVEGAGEYAFRGDTLEVFPADSDLPCLIEFFDDEAERIAYVDIRTRRTKKTADSVKLLPASEALFDVDDLMKNIIDTDIKDKIELYGKYAGCHWLTPAVHNMESFVDYIGEDYNLLFFTEDFRTIFTDFRVLIDDKMPEGENFWRNNFIAPSRMLLHMPPEKVNIMADITTAESETTRYKSSAMIFAGKKGNLYQSMSSAMDIIKGYTSGGYRVLCSIESDRLAKLFTEFSKDYAYIPVEVAKYKRWIRQGFICTLKNFVAALSMISLCSPCLRTRTFLALQRRKLSVARKSSIQQQFPTLRPATMSSMWIMVSVYMSGLCIRVSAVLKGILFSLNTIIMNSSMYLFHPSGKYRSISVRKVPDHA